MPDDDVEHDLRGGIARPGLLTRSDREYLLGEKTYDDPQEERNARQRLRNRIRNALLDFTLLNSHLEERDRRQIFSDVQSQLPAPEHRLREDELAGMVETIAFLYAGTRDAGVPFERLVEQGIQRGAQRVFAAPFVADVSVTIDDTTTIDTDAVIDKVRADEPLSPMEYMHLGNRVVTDTDQIVAATDDVDLAVTEMERTGDQLTPGRSLVLLARLMANTTDVGVDRARAVLDDRVTQEFNLDWNVT